MSDTTTYAYLNEAAPAPKSRETATAEGLARYCLARAQMDVVRAMDHPYGAADNDVEVRKDFTSTIVRMQGYFGVGYLLRQLAVIAPAAADEIAGRLWELWSAGESVPEFTYEWLEELGVDPKQITPDPVEFPAVSRG